MNPTNAQPATSSAALAPPSPATHPHAPNERPATEARPVSQGSITSTHSSRSHQEYLDSLVMPTKDEFAHIAEQQAEREAEQKRAQRHKQRQSIDAVLSPPAQPPHHIPLASRFGLGFGHRPSPSDDGARTQAATVIQRTFRGYRARREIKGLGLDASTRWIHAVREAQWRDMTTPRARAAAAGDGVASPERPGTAAGQPGSRPSTARQNWKKVSTIARHAGNDVDADTCSSSSSSSSPSDSDSGDHKKSEEQKKAARKRKEEAKARRKQEAKMMGLQYFLEMVDLKHRYGANLRVYHEEWKRAETNENFFYWLDYGEGKNLDIEACPRDVLDREQVRYLSRDERQYYLVDVDDDGRLCWAKNGARIDTTQKWKDSVHGIVPSDDPTPAYTPLSENQTTLLGDTTTDSSRPSSSSSSSSSSNSSITSANAARYTSDPSLNPPSTKKQISHHLSGATIFNKLLRKTVRKNTWIFVADTSFRLYVGIKNSGAFQHSSFLQGSRISAAGLIRIRDGRLTSLSPLSGHYRPPASNFRAFVRSLKEAGVDMGRVSVSKSYAVLVGLEMYIKVRKKAGDVVGRVKRGGKKKGGEGEGLVVPQPGMGQGLKHTAGEGERHAGHDTPGHAAQGEGEGEGEGEGTQIPMKEVVGTGPERGVDGQQQHDQQQHQRKDEAKMLEENRLAVEVMQKLNLGAGLTEPRGQKGGGDAEEGGATALSPSHS
ncbi:hypothetical protein C8A01DRAFT_42316 [Parachaetomium inaequale]|uniref:IQ domain-containing protein IQM6 n=1 Tax=Parachaetomium inaequale TaxID=2588326 RepID=A0AAN6P3R5_9PEZI|nr:hypothetical protein C8A01DRAFT_42316 [Parachaetomium inaequale]